MARTPIRTFLGVAVLFTQAAAFWAASAYALECKRKAAGFYLEETDASRPHLISRTLEKLPGSLTGVSGNPEARTGCFISAERAVVQAAISSARYRQP